MAAALAMACGQRQRVGRGRGVEGSGARFGAGGWLLAEALKLLTVALAWAVVACGQQLRGGRGKGGVGSGTRCRGW